MSIPSLPQCRPGWGCLVLVEDNKSMKAPINSFALTLSTSMSFSSSRAFLLSHFPFKWLIHETGDVLWLGAPGEEKPNTPTKVGPML